MDVTSSVVPRGSVNRWLTRTATQPTVAPAGRSRDLWKPGYRQRQHQVRENHFSLFSTHLQALTDEHVRRLSVASRTGDGHHSIGVPVRVVPSACEHKTGIPVSL
jgi:hypothetical protein